MILTRVEGRRWCNDSADKEQSKMRQIDDIAPLVDLADERFRELMDDAHTATNRLADFWTKLYGPNEVAELLRDPLNEIEDTWNEEEARSSAGAG
jgi:hypothetical protein